MKEIAKAYNHEEFEDSIYQKWEKSGYFKPETNMSKIPKYDRKTDGKPFVIMMPPPNVTGKLHVGHSLVLTIQDIMIRYHRLLGEPTLWLPGMDHAGIATQTVVDKSLRKEGINKNDLGREKFIEKVWEWKEKFGGIILEQTRKMGASCDWTRERFTLDEGMNKAVREAFVRLYDKGLIYRGEYIVNWCPRCHTAIADDEVLHIEQKTKLYYFKYDKNFPITIATTRPETKLGDTAVAVNPSDKRYKKYIGQTFKVNIDGVERIIKIIGDRAVDQEFGTGAVGVTPAHSAIDWRMAEENKLPIIKVIDENGRMTAEAGKYQGLKAKEVGEKLLQYFQENGLFEKEEDYVNNLSICYRCNTPIEPMPSLQWFVKMKPLAEKAKEAVKSGKIEIIPKRFEKNYFHWMDNIRDWCISRQLWWGHRLPVWYRRSISNSQFSISNKNSNEQMANEKMNEKWKMINDKSKIYVGIEPPKDLENWEQDPDVLDTWFSSGLWPFSTLGWPHFAEASRGKPHSEDTNDKPVGHPFKYAPGITNYDYQYFYPTTVLETAYEILFFWVARMIMMGIELTGEIPFEKVYLHGLVRDEQNRKMSKSLGNALDPLDVIPKYGTDALRMALVVGSTPGQDLALGESKIKGYRNFSNKIWNASRFVILRVTNGDLKTGETGEEKISDLNIDKNILTAEDKKILHRHTEVISSVTKHLNQYKFSQAGEELYDYFWHDFCDIYIEAAKQQLEDQKVSENTKKILIKILSETLTMLHPFVPFVTEAVWQELRSVYPNLPEFLMIAEWPK